jgi:glycosyltransferase involved in cell wall biosynthesis
MIRPDVIGLTRVRNESLIIEDTIRHFLKHVDNIILYDDCSEDGTAEIAAATGAGRVFVIHGDEWRQDREAEETRHRDLLLRHARAVGAEWALYFDADERLVGQIPEPEPRVNGYTFRLFDGYMTRTHREPYRNGELENLPRLWGPEYRDILMMFRTDERVTRFVGRDQRAPRVAGPVVRATPVYVKHFGKCISVRQWEETCDYYATYFSKRYRKKWLARKGKAIHTLSDFDRTLYTWRQLMERTDSWVKI